MKCQKSKLFYILLAVLLFSSLAFSSVCFAEVCFTDEQAAELDSNLTQLGIIVTQQATLLIEQEESIANSAQEINLLNVSLNGAEKSWQAERKAALTKLIGWTAGGIAAGLIAGFIAGFMVR